MFSDLHFVHYLPIFTTFFSAFFLWQLLTHYHRGGRKPHIMWWCIGVFAYGMGTLLESVITLFGNTVILNKAWYIAGALFGGYPLAQGSVYLHLRKKTADILTYVSLTVVLIVSAFVILSPVNHDALLEHKPSGSVLAWQWVRFCTPLINLYAAFFLIGGAFLSAYRYLKKTYNRYKAIGNILIAVGAILPGIGGGMAKAGYVEALYIGELIGIILIWFGYQLCKKTPTN